MQKPEDFTKFYYTKVGMGEACGCAERVIDVYEFNRKGGSLDQQEILPKKPFRWRNWACKWGLIGRPRS